MFFYIIIAKLESVAMLWSEVKSLRQENDVLMTERDTLQGEMEQVTANLSKYRLLLHNVKYCYLINN